MKLNVIIIYKRCILKADQGKHIFIALLKEGTLNVQEDDGQNKSEEWVIDNT
jgi:hypothetical protein